jgi:hypothetical protein
MALLGTAAKTAVGAKALKAAPAAAKGAVKAGKPVVKAGKPALKRKTRKRLDEATDSLALTLAAYAPRAARQLGLQAPKRKRSTPRVLAGVAIGAAAMYLFEPEHGREHRDRLRALLG